MVQIERRRPKEIYLCRSYRIGLLLCFAVTLAWFSFHSHDESSVTRVKIPVQQSVPVPVPVQQSVPVQHYVHDDPKHPWHWTRENPMCPTLANNRDCDGNLYGDLYHKFHEEGWVVFRSCSLSQNQRTIIDPVAEFTKKITGERVESSSDKAVRLLSTDPDTMKFLEFLHGGRRIFPFQTLNFPKGTQQSLHSDLIHFDSKPRTLMTAAWVALEDMNKDNGPLRFFPKSHQWGTWDYEEMGTHMRHSKVWSNPSAVQEQYGKDLETALRKIGLKESVAYDLKKGQTFVWAAGLVHGGSKQNNMDLTRLSQVTHYFFEGAEYYWIPRLSNRVVGRIKYNNHFPPCSPQFIPIKGKEEFHSCADSITAKWANPSSN